jgi:hypothetical protein
MTILWKALVEHFPMVPLLFFFNYYFQGKNTFSEFFSKNLNPYRVTSSSRSNHHVTFVGSKRANFLRPSLFQLITQE